MNVRLRSLETAAASWFEGHGGVISRGEALALGFSPADVRQRVTSGRWEARYRGVYLLAGSDRSPYQELMAVVTRIGGPVAVSHLSAAWLWALVDRAPPQVYLTVEANHRHPVPDGIVLRRSAVPSATVIRRGLPATPAIRTLIDCATISEPTQLADLLDRALSGRVTTLGAIRAEMAGPHRTRGLPGQAILRRCLSDRGLIGGPTPSVLESRAARLFRRHHLPAPEAEVVWGADGEYRMDFAYVDLRLMIEVDGYAWHSSPEQLQRDHQRRNRLMGDGWTILVYTWRDLDRDPRRVADEIRQVHDRLARQAT